MLPTYMWSLVCLLIIRQFPGYPHEVVSWCLWPIHRFDEPLECDGVHITVENTVGSNGRFQPVGGGTSLLYAAVIPTPGNGISFLCATSIPTPIAFVCPFIRNNMYNRHPASRKGHCLPLFVFVKVTIWFMSIENYEQEHIRPWRRVNVMSGAVSCRARVWIGERDSHFDRRSL